MPYLEECKSRGWRVTLVFLWLPSSEAAVTRVAKRVLKGGHSIPDETVTRRYRSGLRNMREFYLPLADVALIYDNSDEGRVLILEKSPGSWFVHDMARWSAIEGAVL